MKATCLTIFLVSFSFGAGAQNQWVDSRVFNKEFFKYVFNRFKVDEDKSKVFDIIYINLELNTDSKLSRAVSSLNKNQYYLSLINDALDGYSQCYPIDGRLELILYVDKKSNYNYDIFNSSIQAFKENNNIQSDVLAGSILLGRRISCGPQGNNSQPETEKPITLSSTLPKFKIKIEQ